MSTFNFASLNNNFVFELPEGLWDPDNFIKTSDALEKYGDDSVVVIAYGITNIDREKHPDAVSDRSAWIATEEEIINVPSFQLPIIEGILHNEDAIETCQNGCMTAKFVEYSCKYGDRVKIEFGNR